MNAVTIYFCIFLFYSFIGWLIEVFCKFITEKRFINRGFLIGPYLPIYGCGALFITIMLTRYKSDPFLLFCMSLFSCSVLEYITSYLMEKILKARWWDYSHSSFHINGRICLTNSLLFGIGGVCIVEWINPIFLPFLVEISSVIRNVFCLCAFLIIMIDVIVSYNIILKFSKTASFLLQDRTEEIAAFVKKSTKSMKENVIDKFRSKMNKWNQETSMQLKKLYSKQNILYRRLLSAFPNVEVRNRKTEKIFFQILKKVRKDREKYEYAKFKTSKNKRKK